MAMLLLTIFFCSTFLLSSLVLNFIQLVNYLLIWPHNKRLYRRINYFLAYSSWSQVVAIAEWCAGSKVQVFANEKTWETFGKQHSLVLMNHKYEVDWIVTWMTSDKFKILGGCKCFAKSSLRSLPIIGWTWIFCEMIFLDRNWTKDKETLGTKLDAILENKDTESLMLLFPEGTRFTLEKYEASMEFAKSKNLPQMKFHLLPRTKGFNFCAAHLKDKTTCMFNIQLGFPKGTNPSVLSILKGEPMFPDIYIDYIPIKDIPTDSDEAMNKFMYDLYHKKDDLMENYWKTGKFPGKAISPRRRITPLLNLVIWSAITGLPVIYFVLKVILSGSVTTIMITATIFALAIVAVYFLLGATQATKGSSYGKTSPNKTNGKANGELPNGETH